MIMPQAKKQIKSKERVAAHGEVFTNEREVKAMCDLVSQECDRFDSRFLEPACGDGNFLAEIFTRKLARVRKLYKNSTYDYERYSLLALSSLYGVDILLDNAQACRARLFAIWDKAYKSVCKKECDDQTCKAASYILSQNILCGNALTMMQVNSKQEDTQKPIIFPQWSFVKGSKLQRRDFRLDVLLKANEKPVKKGLFDDDLAKYLSINPTTGEYMPEPIKIYPAVHYKQIQEIK